MNKKNLNAWNLGLLYSSIDDVKIEKDIQIFENLCESFSQKYSNGNFTNDDELLLESLNEYERYRSMVPHKSWMYLTFITHLDSSDNKAQAKLSLLSNRLTNASNKVVFYRIILGKIDNDRQEYLLNSDKFKYFNYFLLDIFKNAQYSLSDKEEKIINLKSQPAYEMWCDSHSKLLTSISIKWKGKVIPLSEANNKVSGLKTSERAKLYSLINLELKKISAFSEAEMNAILTDKKIEDELRGYSTPYESTILGYENDPVVVEKLVKTVTDSFPISHKFFKIKAKLLKQKVLKYCDRNANIGYIKSDFSFDKSVKMFSNTLDKFDNKYSEIFKEYISNGQIDVYPKIGKIGGAYCWGTYSNPTFVLLNHSNELRSYSTLAHEMGHAFHTELSKTQGPIYSGYSTSLAETASTFFESLAFDEMIETLPEKQKIIALHNKLNEDISIIFRQIACFNFEKDLHSTLRKNGMVSKEEMADLHNKNMKSYLGPVFKMDHDDGYFFVQWGHIRRFFYVYTYAYGLLVSKAMHKKYREDKNFKNSIEQFLKAGGKDTPENILKEIGIDISSGQVFRDGIEEIKRDISTLEKLCR